MTRDKSKERNTEAPQDLPSLIVSPRGPSRCQAYYRCPINVCGMSDVRRKGMFYNQLQNSNGLREQAGPNQGHRKRKRIATTET